ncbi:MotA/TolQ/ExbB proton channel family protein [Ornithinibacillus halophilus]|uniref:MotA/TolQ/ExbB proton channel family protein n=1 Tax=Ornithinibacillus halophilus TaxID=930117 RepID=A0A1M5NDL6_9BACI|nr:MotA/TolQ/ExbB proton channel family protein [Ornithinibacillus halophilus]SHG87664.1 MotA/TolQ/ExbB proton channel family protein [Ornithinibacillus halophilus]
MLQSILEIFTSEAKAEAILSSPLVELIFMVLFIAFFVTLFVHIALYGKLRKLRNYLHETNRMDIEPLQSFKSEYDKRLEEDTVKAETFVQEKFSGWRVFSVPVVSLIKLIQTTVSVFILIGVLGTFIGLTMSLGSINAGGDQIVENVASVLAGIDIAFYTSIAGMGFSLIMTVLTKVLNTEHVLTDIMLKVESNLNGHKENGISRLIDVSENIHQSIVDLKDSNQQSLQGIEQAFEGFQAYTSGLQQSAKDLATFNEGLGHNLQEFQELFGSMQQVTDGFSEGTKRLNDNFDSLFMYFKKMDSRNERMVQGVEGTFDKMKEVSDIQMDTLKNFEGSVEELKSFITTIIEEQQSAFSTINKIVQQSNQLVKKMEAHNKEFKQIFGSDLSSKLGGITTYLGELTRDFDRLGESIVQLPDALEVVNQTQAEHKHLLMDRFEELKHFNQTFNKHLKEHAVESMTFEKHLREATSSYEQLGMKNNQLINEINSTINQISQNYSHRENQLESSVGLLKDALTKYTSGVESSLGEKMEKVVRNISDSMNTTNEGIKREFMELRRLSEDVQQNNARYTQQMIQELSREIQILNRQLSMFSQQGLQRQRQNTIGMNQNEY